MYKVYEKKIKAIKSKEKWFTNWEGGALPLQSVKVFRGKHSFFLPDVIISSLKTLQNY
jgi:hypothetical protein